MYNINIIIYHSSKGAQQLETKHFAYKIFKSQIFSEDSKLITSYGIQSTNLQNNIVIKDVTTQLNKIEKFINLCNRHDVSILNLNDLIEDFFF